MNILLTGGCGFIGSHCAVELLLSEYNVIIIDNLANSSDEILNGIEAITNKRPVFYKGDLANYNDINQVFVDHKIEVVMHLASHKAVPESITNPLKYYNNNITGLLNLLNCMEQHNVRKFIFSSSATVYGEPKCLPLTEESVINTLNPYGRTKLFSEEILKDCAATGNLQVICLRYFNPVGAHSSGIIGENPTNTPSNLFPVIMSIYQGKREYLEIFGGDYDTADGTCIRDYIHVVDLSLGHVKALRYFNDNTRFEVFNLGSSTGYSVLQIKESFEKLSGLPLPFVIKNRRQGDAPDVYTSTEKAEKELNWKPTKSLTEMIVDTLRYNKLYNKDK
jgi:UDP-glucose 4-epimerase